MTTTASAPGKMILLGEYAVLEGAPAIVLAVDRRAVATIAPSTATSRSPGRPPRADIRVLAPDLGIDASASVGPRGKVAWAASAGIARRLHLVESVLTATFRDRIFRENDVIPGGFDPTNEGYTLTLSTRAFFDTPGTKLGLGSSAALTTALTGALRCHLGLPPATLAELVRLHRSMQGGRGSGADIGAALTGGVIAYRTGGAPKLTEQPPTQPPQQPATGPTAEAATLPAGLHWCCVFTGRSASTPRMLARLRDWRGDRPDGYRARMTQLTTVAQAGACAVGRGETTETLDAIAAYADGLDALGTDAGIDIMSARHREIRNVAARCGVIYKPSGAGGGDIGIGVSRDSSHIDALRRALSPLGYRMIDMSIDRRGLTVDDGKEPARAYHAPAAAGHERQR